MIEHVVRGRPLAKLRAIYNGPEFTKGEEFELIDIERDVELNEFVLFLRRCSDGETIAAEGKLDDPPTAYFERIA